MTWLALDARERADATSPLDGASARLGSAGVLLGACALALWEASAHPVLTSAPLDRASFAALSLLASLALYLFIARCISPAAGRYAVVVLATLPIWFVRARADGTSLALPIVTLAALGAAVLATRLCARTRVVLVAVAAVAGYFGAREAGLAIAIGAPALAVGVAKGKGRAAVISASAGVLVITGAIGATTIAPTSALAIFLFGARGTGGVSFAARIAPLVYGLAPWSALLPFALTRRPTHDARRSAQAALVVAALLTVTLESARAPSHVTYACGALAGCLGAFLPEASAERAPTTLLAIGVFALGALVAHDVGLAPDRVLDVLAPALPTGQSTRAARVLRIAVWTTNVAVVVALLADARWLTLGRVRIERGVIVALAGALGGLVLRVDAYPDLLRHVSPGRALEAWLDRRREGDVLGLLGVDDSRWPGVRTAGAGRETVRFANAEGAARWLAEGHGKDSGGRRFLAIGPTELARTNAAFRQARHSNLPVVSGNGAFLLGVSALGDGERSENPLDPIVRADPPAGMTPLAATLGDRAAHVLGWQAALKGRSGHVRIVLDIGKAALLRGHCTFLHVDHAPTRYGAEHREYTYPIALWQEHDVIVDDFEVELPPHFTRGKYALYWGVGVLPCQDDRRIEITSGPTDGRHRLALGKLEVQ